MKLSPRSFIFYLLCSALLLFSWLLWPPLESSGREVHGQLESVTTSGSVDSFYKTRQLRIAGEYYRAGLAKNFGQSEDPLRQFVGKKVVAKVARGLQGPMVLSLRQDGREILPYFRAVFFELLLSLFSLGFSLICLAKRARKARGE